MGWEGWEEERRGKFTSFCEKDPSVLTKSTAHTCILLYVKWYCHLQTSKNLNIQFSVLYSHKKTRDSLISEQGTV
jgi:hypothetical protein